MDCDESKNREKSGGENLPGQHTEVRCMAMALGKHQQQPVGKLLCGCRWWVVIESEHVAGRLGVAATTMAVSGWLSCSTSTSVHCADMRGATRARGVAGCVVAVMAQQSTGRALLLRDHPGFDTVHLMPGSSQVMCEWGDVQQAVPQEGAVH
jgi:hypothetical protein